MKNGKMADMESVILVVQTMMANNASHLLPEVLGTLKQIKTQWPVRSDIQTEKQKLQLIKSSYKNGVLTEGNAKNELLAVGEKIEGLDEQRLKDLTNTGNLNAIFSGSMACVHFRSVFLLHWTKSLFHQSYSDLALSKPNWTCS
ncbi:hypothetical protein ES319_D02G218500v1 [Gossypium barbadense]|uniref:Uncharacterized protein n=1 Tax=Gossypium barbadense TaxID=3634 RepID=A0A5J5SG30_GOSBA|nr:hypothetical protein ES319_D02G218500v1 [Gossypium barbadense]KAB2042461.1 hypothetical protein ES319_D02G218500v1 [Gossypium barbadense]